MKNQAQQIPKGPFQFLFFASRQYKLLAFLATTFSLMAAIMQSFVPYTFKRIVDSVNGLSGLGPENVGFWVGVYIGLSFLNAMFWRVSGFSGMRLMNGIRATTQNVLMAHLTKHSTNFFSNRFAGALGNKIANATDGLHSLPQDIFWGWLSFVVQLVINIGIVFYTNIYIGGIFLLWIMVVVPINIYYVKKKIPIGLKAQIAKTELRAQTIDVLTNIHAMNDYARRDFELNKLAKLTENVRVLGIKNWTASEISLTVNSLLETLFTGVMAVGTIYLWSHKFITAGDIVLILTLVVSIRGSLTHLGRNFNGSADTYTQVEEGLAEILHDHEIKDAPEARTLQVFSGEIVFNNIDFKYENIKIFNGLSLAIKSGQRVGLIGRSGAGKSTLMKLLMRQYDLSDGSITIDEQDISKVRQESLHEAIGVVPQDPLLFHRSLKENIGYGKISATDQEIELAAEHAQAHKFIDILPKRYETLVGERGVKLSGGERQRVAIARAFLKDAKILLLDEATSALDSESEKMIQGALEKLMEGKTVIAIAHRLSTLRAMDRLVVMDKGQIVEDGTHEELLQLGGIYAELWAHQAGGFIKEG